ncbi:MAG: SET domain-containing protein [Acidobacteria bacterium]|nr:SET domain-containing protein [Acidobacteriota bacterium]
MLWPTRLPKTVRKRSRLHGWGVFAGESINKNTRIIDYAGELISKKVSDIREDTYLN